MEEGPYHVPVNISKNILPTLSQRDLELLIKVTDILWKGNYTDHSGAVRYRV